MFRNKYDSIEFTQEEIEVNNNLYGFKILGNQGCYSYDDLGFHRKWLDELKEILHRNHIYDSDNFTIAKCTVGDSSFPICEIVLNNGLNIYLESYSPHWAKEENDKKLNEYKNKLK